MGNPLVSIVIPTYNRPDLLKRSLRSALDQTYQNIEIVVVDDGDSCIPTISDQRVVYIKNTRKKGACGARNTGIYACRGKYVANLDDDDQFVPRRIENMLLAFERCLPSFVCSAYEVRTQAHARLVGRTSRRITFRDLLWGNCVGPQILTTRCNLIGVGGFDEDLASSQDLDLWLRLVRRWGDALRIGERLSIVYADSDRNRISIGPRKVAGMHQQFTKFEADMTPVQRSFRRAIIDKYNGNRRWWANMLPVLMSSEGFNHLRHRLIGGW